jgi:hypothetical protein
LVRPEANGFIEDIFGMIVGGIPQNLGLRLEHKAGGLEIGPQP